MGRTTPSIVALFAAVLLAAMVAFSSVTTAAADGHEPAAKAAKRGPEVTLKLKPGTDACRLHVKVERAPRGSKVLVQVRSGRGGWATEHRSRVGKGSSTTRIGCAAVDPEVSVPTTVRALLKRGKKTLDKSQRLEVPGPTVVDEGKLSSGTYHTCAIRTDASIACWGVDSYGQATPPAGSFKSVSAGDLHTCAFRIDASIACWGEDGFGQATPEAGSFKSVSAGGSHTCALRTDASIACWGSNVTGQVSTPNGRFTSVGPGGSHTCAIRIDASIVCWGYNDDGQASPPAGSFKSVSAGADHTCAIRTDTSIACWGDDTYGQATPPAGL